MARLTPSLTKIEPEGGYWVELPRSCDAVGSSLRGAFDFDVLLPEDMKRLLNSLSSDQSPKREH